MNVNEFVTHLILQSPLLGVLFWAIWSLWGKLEELRVDVANIKGQLKRMGDYR